MFLWRQRSLQRSGALKVSWPQQQRRASWVLGGVNVIRASLLTDWRISFTGWRKPPAAVVHDGASFIQHNAAPSLGQVTPGQRMPNLEGTSETLWSDGIIGLMRRHAGGGTNGGRSTAAWQKLKSKSKPARHGFSTASCRTPAPAGAGSKEPDPKVRVNLF